MATGNFRSKIYQLDAYGTPPICQIIVVEAGQGTPILVTSHELQTIAETAYALRAEICGYWDDSTGPKTLTRESSSVVRGSTATT